MNKPSKWMRFKVSISHVINVLFADGREDEMLSSYAYRVGDEKLIRWLNWLFEPGHCAACYYWEIERRKSYKEKGEP